MAKEAEMKIILGENDIVFVDISKQDTSGEDILEIMEEIRNFIKKFSGKAKILVDFKKPVTKLGSSELRKKIAKLTNDSWKDPGFYKLAICGINSLLRVAVLFVMKATNIDNVKIFEKKEEALKWLKS